MKKKRLQSKTANIIIIGCSFGFLYMFMEIFIKPDKQTSQVAMILLVFIAGIYGYFISNQRVVEKLNQRIKKLENEKTQNN
jgi:uncharacterized membrane protein